jgi:hypothetical protein
MRLKKCVERNLNINRIKYLKEGAENSNVYLLGFVFMITLSLLCIIDYVL